MSIFKTKGIILKKINKQKDLIYVIFTQDYGKISAFVKNSKKEKKLDLGYIISFEIKTFSNNKNLNILNIKIINEFNYLKYDFETIHFYQILLTLIFKLTPEKKQIFNILEIIEKINFFSSSLDNKKMLEKIILACLKIINILGLLDINHKKLEVKKILYFINKNNFYTISKLTGIEENTQKILENIILKNIN